MGSQGFWPISHSSESVQKREISAHKASDLNQTVLTTVKHALIFLNTGLACFDSVERVKILYVAKL